MRTSDFTTKPNSRVMNETLNKKFGEKLDIENYSLGQLRKASELIENRISVLKKSNFNETLESEEFHRLKLMQDIVRTAISERAVSKAQQQAAGAALAAKRKGSGAGLKGPSKAMSKMSKKELEKFAGTKHKGLPKHKKTDESKNVKEEPNEGNKFGKAVRDAKKDGIQKGEKVKVGGKTYPVKEAQVSEISNKTKQDYTDAALARQSADKKTGWSKKGEEKKGKKADAARSSFKKRSTGTYRAQTTMKESYEYLREGEESKAELIMAVKDMVDKFTGWSEDIAQMQAQTAMEMADAIRDELGADQAEAFTASVQPSLDSAFQAVKAAREALNNSVASLTGVAPTPMGAEPGMDMDMEPDMGMEPDMDMGMEPGMEPEDDMGDEMPSPMDRAKRESIEDRLRLTKILVGR